MKIKKKIKKITLEKKKSKENFPKKKKKNKT